MKKTIILSAALLILCLLTACGVQSTSSDGSAIEADVTETADTSTTAATVESSIVEESSAIEQSSPKSNNSSSTVISQTSSIVTTGCTHDYTKKVVAPTCTEKGYTLHTCKKCGKSYSDSSVAPRHEYGKYLCDICGLPDPESPIYSLSAWLKKNGTESDNGNYFYIDYEENGISYSISTSISYTSGIYFDLDKGEDIFRVYSYTTDKCSIYSRHDRISGDVKLKNSVVCSSYPLKLDSFENTGSIVCSEEEFVAQMKSKIDGFMIIIQDKMLYPRTGLKLKNLGFTAY